MPDLERIVFPTDFSECSDHALDYAVFMAGQFDSQLHLLHAQVLHGEDPANDAHGFPEAHALLDRLERVAHSELGARAQRSDVAVLRIRQAQRRGFDAGSVILDFAKEIDAGLIVMGTHGRRGARRLLLGSVAEDVLRRSPNPVLLVREAGERTHLESIESILVPIDFSAASRNALAKAADLATSLGARLRLLHVVNIPALPSVYGQPLVLDMSDLSRRALTALENLAAEHKLDDAELAAVVGDPATEIVAESVKAKVGMIVMPPHTGGYLSDFLTGRTTDQVVRRAPCPVLTTGLASTTSAGRTVSVDTTTAG
jgi:nucleotide-binding universal stress UspA family protein